MEIIGLDYIKNKTTTKAEQKIHKLEFYDNNNGNEGCNIYDDNE